MPFRRRYGPQKRRVFRPKGRRANPWARYGAKGGMLAQKAFNLAKYLKSLINVEKHKFDVSLSSTNNQNDTPVTTHITAIPIGDTEGTRTGNTIMTKYLYVRGRKALDPSGPNYARVREVIVRDKQQIADSAPGYADVFESTGTQAFLNKNTVGRFDILHDKIFDLDAQNPQQIYKYYIPLGQSHVRYNGTGASDVQKGGLYSFTLSDSAATGPQSSATCRLMYIDN